MHTQPNQQIQDLTLNGDWQFAYLPTWDSATRAFPEAARFCAQMPVPMYWDDCLDRLRPNEIWRSVVFNPVEPFPVRWPTSTNPPDASLPYLIGTGFYKRTIQVPSEWRERTITLRVGQATLEAWVWVNGKFAAHHQGHSVPFEVPLEPLLAWGAANEIVIAVSNVRTDRRGCSLRGFSGRSGGIRYGVSLHVAGPARIVSLFIRANPAAAGARWKLEVAGPAGKASKLEGRWQICNASTGVTCAQGIFAGSGPELEWETERLGLEPWSDRHPACYEAKIQLLEAGKMVDERRQPFGLRTFERDGTSLLLNGVPVFLRGTTEMHYFPLTCTAPEDLQTYRANLRALKEVGFNWLRFHTWVPSHEYLQAADELGLLVQIEPPSGSTLEEWTEIVRSCRIHPSVVLYCGGNEAELDEQMIEFLRGMAQVQRRLAPDALFSPMEALGGIEYAELGEGVVEHPFPHRADRLAKIKEFSDVLESYNGELSYHSVRGGPEVLERRLKIYERPILSHELCIHGNYLNLDLEQRYEGTRIGTGLFAATRRHLSEEGLLEKAALYYRNACAHMRVQRKHAMETARKCSLISGYDLLGAIDSHWHRWGYPCGIMNEFYELKPGESAEEVRRYNGESVLLFDGVPNRNLRPGQALAGEVLASFYGPQSVPAGTLFWSLTRAHDVLASGSWACGELRNGGLRKLGSLNLPAPKLSSAAQVTLHLRFQGGPYELENRWEYWIFPEPETAPAAVPEAAALRAADLQRLTEGGDLVLLGSGPFPAAEIRFQSSSSGRAGGHKGTVIADHPLMESFPHTGYCDWQFFEMLDTQAKAVTFERPELPFEPIIEMISPFKRILKMAVLFEYRVGRGRLLVCSLNLRRENPAAAWLRHMIQEYVSGPRFNPKAALAPETLRQLLVENGPTEEWVPTDQARDPNALSR